MRFSAALESLKNELRYMKIEKKISLLFLFVALLATAACGKEGTPTAEEKTPVGFRAMSQAASVKSGSDAQFPYDNFGVWGIARQDGLIYNLWTNSPLMEVFDPEGRIANKIPGSDNRVFTPRTDAYWINGYTYNFLAVAPYGDSDFSFGSITTKEQQSSVDCMSFTYDLSGKYSSDLYDFDFLGASAQTSNTAGGRTQSQQLIFWHLFSKIKITVKFVDGENKEVTSTTLDKIVINGVKTAGNYTLAYGGTEENPHALNCVVSNQSNATSLEFTAAPSLNIIPQDISDFSMFIDFTMKAGDTDVIVKNFEIDLTKAKEAAYDSATETSPYSFNNWYNWNITIGPKQVVTFTVKVNEWVDGGTVGEEVII